MCRFEACDRLLLWSDLGATLSSERGSLEARIEALTEEGRTLRSQLNTEIDTVKIKAKLVADLTETVSQLKQKLSQSEGACDEKEKQLQNIKVSNLVRLLFNNFVSPRQNSCQEWCRYYLLSWFDLELSRVSLGDFLLTPGYPIKKVL